MQLKCKFSTDGLMTDVWFDGLNGGERVTSVSQAITRLRVKNPAVVFTEDAKAGLFDAVSDAEYESMLRSVECIAMLWRYKGDKPADKSTRKEVNVLTLLANAIALLSQQNIQLKTPTAIAEEPDFAPDPIDEETLAAIEEAEARKAAMDVWEMQDGEELELDDFGNPIVRRDNPVRDDPEACGIPDVVEERSADVNSGSKPNKPNRK